MMNIRLDGHTALVCGATDGIGKAIAHAFAGAGCRVIVLARNEEKVQSVVSELPISALKEHGHCGVVVDLDAPEQVHDAVVGVLDTVGTIDIVVNNSGGPPGGPLMDSSVDSFHRAFDRLLMSSHTIVQLCVPGMKKLQSGRILNVISTSVRQPLDNLGVSNTVRSATSAWAKTLSRELGIDGITVNNILPGATSTSRLHSIIQAGAKRTGRSVEEVEAEMLEEIPMRRFATPDDIASGALFLASEQASYITGINLTIDGGRTRSLL